MREALRWFRGGDVGVALNGGRWGCLSPGARVVLVLVTRLCCRTNTDKHENHSFPSPGGLLLQVYYPCQFSSPWLLIHETQQQMRRGQSPSSLCGSRGELALPTRTLPARPWSNKSGAVISSCVHSNRPC